MVNKWMVVYCLSFFVFDTHGALKRLSPSQDSEDEIVDIINDDFEDESSVELKSKLFKKSKDLQFNETVDVAHIKPGHTEVERSGLSNRLATIDEHGQPFKSYGKEEGRVRKTFRLSTDNTQENVLEKDFSVDAKKYGGTLFFGNISLIFSEVEKLKVSCANCDKFSNLSELEPFIDMKTPVHRNPIVINLEKVYKEIELKRNIYKKYCALSHKRNFVFDHFAHWFLNVVVPELEQRGVILTSPGIRSEFIKILRERKDLVDALIDANIGFSVHFVSESNFAKIWDKLMPLYAMYKMEIAAGYNADDACRERYFHVPEEVIVNGEAYLETLRAIVGRIRQQYEDCVQQEILLSETLKKEIDAVPAIENVVRWVEKFLSVIKQEKEDYEAQQREVREVMNEGARNEDESKVGSSTDFPELM